MHFIDWPESNSVELARRLRVLPGFVWLDSSDATHAEGRFSFLSALPQKEVRSARGGIDALDFLSQLPGGSARSRAPETELSDIKIPHWIGWIAYDALDPSTMRSADNPAAIWFGCYPAIVCVDHKRARCFIVGDDEQSSAPLIAALDCSATEISSPHIEQLAVDSAANHVTAIHEALELIAAGEIYQVNLARRWRALCKGDVFALWLAMRRQSPVPLGAYLCGGETRILASTMERFLGWDRQTRRLFCAPIKGTLAHAPQQDDESLKQNPKERAEHTMIVDLIRNDLGRVAEPGSVQLEEPFRVEPFAGLSHLISTVSCRTCRDIGLRDILLATFPPGSVTGTPKIRAQQVIEKLETHARGVYCGAIGCVDREGGLSLSVAIRTAVQHNTTIDYWAGGGIVEASDPEAEVAETELKAQVFLRAIDSLKSTQ